MMYPDDRITRQEMAVILANAVGEAENKPGTEFDDIGDAAQWAADKIATAVSDGLVNGYPDGTFRPLEMTRRDEAFAVIYRLMKQLNKF